MEQKAKFEIYAALAKVAFELDRADEAFIAHEPCGLHHEHQDLLDMKRALGRIRQRILEMA